MQKTNYCRFLPSVGQWESDKCLPPSVGEDREGWNPSPFRTRQRGPQSSDSRLTPFVFT